MSISAVLVKELRGKSGAGIMECKNALKENDGDVDKAIDYLRKKGILSVLLQTFYDIEYCFTVDENQFSPPPKVKSAVIRLVRNKRKKIDVDLKSYKMIIKAAYNQRRKTINNALKSFNLKKDDKTKHLLKLRAENLCVNDFINITSNIQ